jgi:hypothetical protein
MKCEVCGAPWMVREVRPAGKPVLLCHPCYGARKKERKLEGTRGLESYPGLPAAQTREKCLFCESPARYYDDLPSGRVYYCRHHSVAISEGDI